MSKRTATPQQRAALAADDPARWCEDLIQRLRRLRAEVGAVRITAAFACAPKIVADITGLIDGAINEVRHMGTFMCGKPPRISAFPPTQDARRAELGQTDLLAWTNDTIRIVCEMSAEVQWLPSGFNHSAWKLELVDSLNALQSELFNLHNNGVIALHEYANCPGAIGADLLRESQGGGG